MRSKTNLFTAAKEERVQIIARHSDEMWCSFGFGGEVKTGLNVLFPHWDGSPRRNCSLWEIASFCRYCAGCMRRKYEKCARYIFQQLLYFIFRVSGDLLIVAIPELFRLEVSPLEQLRCLDEFPNSHSCGYDDACFCCWENTNGFQYSTLLCYISLLPVCWIIDV